MSFLRIFCILGAVTAAVSHARADELTPRDVRASEPAVVFCYDRARDVVARLLSSECHGTVVSEAEARAIAERRDQQVKRALAAPRVGHEGLGRAEHGTAFYVDEVGRLLTSYHVVAGCAAISVIENSGAEQPARTLAIDVMRDLALLQVDTVPPAMAFFGSDDASSAEAFVAVVGYPDQAPTSGGPRGRVGELLAPSLSDLSNEHTLIKADIRDGDSGSPLLDRRGLVIGIVDRTADADALRLKGLKSREASTVAFGIPLALLFDFLDRYDARYQTADSRPVLEAEKIFSLGRQFVTRVDCWK